jgi:hypothetical protein
VQCLPKKNRFLACTLTKILRVKRPSSTPSDTNILIQMGLIYTCWRNVYHAHHVNYSFSHMGLYIVQPWKIPRFLLVLIFVWYHTLTKYWDPLHSNWVNTHFICRNVQKGHYKPYIIDWTQNEYNMEISNVIKILFLIFVWSNNFFMCNFIWAKKPLNVMHLFWWMWTLDTIFQKMEFIHNVHL